MHKGNYWSLLTQCQCDVVVHPIQLTESHNTTFSWDVQTVHSSHTYREGQTGIHTHWQCRMDTAIRNGPIHLASPNAHLLSAFITCTHPLQVHHQDVALLFHVYYSCIRDMQCLKLTSSVHTHSFLRTLHYVILMSTEELTRPLRVLHFPCCVRPPWSQHYRP